MRPSPSVAARALVDGELDDDAARLGLCRILGRCPMPLKGLGCQLAKSVHSDACPRPTAGGRDPLSQDGGARGLQGTQRTAALDDYEPP